MSGCRNVSISEPRELKEQHFGSDSASCFKYDFREKVRRKIKIKALRVIHEHPSYIHIHIHIHPNLKLNFPLHAESTGKNWVRVNPREEGWERLSEGFLFFYLKILQKAAPVSDQNDPNRYEMQQKRTIDDVARIFHDAAITLDFIKTRKWSTVKTLTNGPIKEAPENITQHKCAMINLMNSE